MNPSPRFSGPNQRAASFFEELHWGNPPRKVTRVRKPEVAGALTELGRLDAVEYSTNKKGDGPSTYRHEFGEWGGRKPRLAVDPERKRLHIVSGGYRVERRGIVD